MNRTIIMLPAMLLALFFTSGASYAAVNEISDEQMQEVRAACEAEAKEATYPNEYIEECVAEKIQALKADQSEQSKDAS